MTYGVPYKGSKSSIAEWVVENLPPNETFVDIFAGGCAITHAAMLSGKFERFIANDRLEAPEIFLSAINGEFEGYTTVPTREEFFETDDEAMKIMNSFGNDRTTYLYGKEIEPIKTEAAKMITGGSVYERKKSYSRFIKNLFAYLEKKDIKERKVIELQNLECLQRLQNLEHLQSSGGQELLQILHLDYRRLEIPENSTVYADPPYRGTNTKAYETDFDFEAFDTWLSIVPFPVIVSEYTAPKGCVEIAAKEKRVLSDSKNSAGKRLEKLFIQERFAEEYFEQMKG